MNVAIHLTFLLTHLSQVIHFYDYLRGRGQPYMKLFDMMSGRVTPYSLGLNDEKMIKDILYKTRIAFLLNDLVRYSAVFVCLMVVGMAFILHFSSIEYLAIGLAHALNFGVCNL